MSSGVVSDLFCGNSMASTMVPPGNVHSTSSPLPNPDRPFRRHYNSEYPKELWYFIGSVILLVAVFQFVSFFHSKLIGRRREVTITDPESPSSAIPWDTQFGRVSLAFVNAYRIIAFRCTVGVGSYTLNFAEVFVTAVYIIVVSTWSFVRTTSVSGHKLDIGYWTNRTGALAASQIPLITALGTKNNVIGFIIGLSHEKLNYLHRMMARVIMILLWVHGGSHIYKGLGDDIHAIFVQAGLLAVTAFSLLCLVSLRPVRAASYEFFFYTHFAMVLIMLLGAYFHTRNFNLDSYIWPSFIAWGLDRSIRALRLVTYNCSYFGLMSSSQKMDASTEIFNDHFVRLTLRRPSHFYWSPGQMVYLILPSVSSLPFEAHPFTIASFDSNLFADDKNRSGTTASDWKELVFLINVRSGFTKRLRDRAVEGGTVKVFIDGPYGSSPDLRGYNTVVLIAGGSGVSYTFPVLLDIIEKVFNGASNCTRVVFVWAIRDIGCVRWISDTLSKALQKAPSSLCIEIRVHITGASLESPLRVLDNGSIQSGPDDNKEDKYSTLVLGLAGVKVTEGRPDIDALLQEEVGMTTGRMFVSVCGSQGIVSAVRHALRFSASGPTNIMKGGPSVTLHVESFNYA